MGINERPFKPQTSTFLFNRIQNKSLCLHNMCVYNYFAYINTHTCMYIFKKYLHEYTVYIYIEYKY